MNKDEAIKYGYPYTFKIRIHGEPFYMKMTEAIKEHECFICERIIAPEEVYYSEIYPKWLPFEMKPDSFSPIKLCWDCITLENKIKIETK